MIELDAAPGRTPLANEYREIVRRTARVGCALGPFDSSAYDPRSIRRARAHWRTRMMDEYVSTAVYSSLSVQLLEANASLDTNVVMLRMAQDEFRHAELCGEVARALGGSRRARRDVALRPIPRHAGCSAQERVLRNVLVTSISEMYSVAYFVASLDRMTDPYLRTVTRALLADEILHGRFAFHFLENWTDWLAAHADARASISGYLGLAFAACESEFVREGRGDRGDDDDALGLVSADDAREIFRETMAHAVAPGLDRFGLEATRAWNARGHASKLGICAT